MRFVVDYSVYKCRKPVSADVAWMNTETATNTSSAAETRSRKKRTPATDAVIPVTITF